jgi:hypothetical protein
MTNILAPFVSNKIASGHSSGEQNETEKKFLISVHDYFYIKVK